MAKAAAGGGYGLSRDGLLARLLAPPLLLLAGGCCGLADWLGCYPDATLTPVSYRTPEETLRTLQQAALFGDVDQLYLCLSQGFKRRTGLDSLAAHVAWSRLQEEFPFLRSLFRAETVGRQALPGLREELLLAAYGRRFRLVFKAEPYVEILALERGEDGRIVARTVVDADLAGGLARVVQAAPGGGLLCRLADPAWREDLAGLDPATLGAVTVGVEWKLDEAGGAAE